MTPTHSTTDPILVAVPDDGVLAGRVRGALNATGAFEVVDDGDVIIVTEPLLHENGDVPWVAVCRAGDAHTARRALEAGATGIVDAEHLESTIASAVRMAAEGYFVVPHRLKLRVVPPTLSHRERQVLALVVAGGTNAQIAQRLILSESTVKSHLATAFAKLGVHTRRDAVSLLLSADVDLMVDARSTVA